MSTQIANTVSAVILNAAVDTGSFAFAAACLTHPLTIGAGAVFGGVVSLSGHLIARLGRLGIQQLDRPNEATAVKTLVAVLDFFGSMAAAWGTLAAMGISLTLSHVVTLVATAVVTSIIVRFSLDLIGVHIPRTTPVGAR